MRAVIFKDVRDVAVEERPIPNILNSEDIIVRVKYSALCGSELHVFRGHQPSKTGFIMGHEFTGTVLETGSSVRNFKKGDKVISPFTVSCGGCFYCNSGFSSRCEKSLLFGCPLLDGAQAEYVRVPLGDTTVVKALPGIDETKQLLMADIFPTGYFAVCNAFKGMNLTVASQSTVVVLGCGPVGLCALVNALEFKPKHLLAVDGIDDRLALAKQIGAEPWNFLTHREALNSRVHELTDGRGADIVIEVVGSSPALRMAFDLLRPWGIISSVGVHNGQIPWTGNEAYGKNLTLYMGRCPVRSIFPDALKVFKRSHHLLDFMVSCVLPMTDAVEGYRLFESMAVQKVIFDVEN